MLAHLWVLGLRGPYLRTQIGFFVKLSLDEIAVLAGRDATLTMDADTAGVSDHFTDHVLSEAVAGTRSALLNGRLCVGLSTNGPLGDVVRPFVRMNTCWRIAKSAQR